LLVAVAVVDADTDDLAGIRHRRQQPDLVEPVVGGARGQRLGVGDPILLEQPLQHRDAEPRADVDDAVVPHQPAARHALGREAQKAHQDAASGRPARSSTASSFAASSSVAGAIGRRCSFFGMIPQRIIMYFIGIGLVSKKTALLISSSASCSARARARSPASTASHRSASARGRRLPTAFMSPHAPTAIIGKLSSSRPTKILKSGPKACMHSETNPRSFTACFMPTKCSDSFLMALSVSSVTLTAVLPGM